MNTILRNIVVKLQNRNISITAESVEKHRYQGFMSTVYTADSSRGKIVIHVADLVEPHVRDKVWEKFEGLASLLASHPEIPTPKFLYSDYADGKLILVQEFSEGERAGMRTLHDSGISDEWHADQDKVFPAIIEVMAKVHAVEMEGFGWPNIHKEFSGPYSTWDAFLTKETSRWIGAIRAIESEFADSLEVLVRKSFRHISYGGTAVLVHGDASNLSNILVRPHGMMILDWEWAIAADPAWEFAGLGWKSAVEKGLLAPYFVARGLDSEAQAGFLARISLYEPFWLLWATHVHASKGGNRQFYELLKVLLVKSEWLE